MAAHAAATAFAVDQIPTTLPPLLHSDSEESEHYADELMGEDAEEGEDEGEDGFVGSG